MFTILGLYYPYLSSLLEYENYNICPYNQKIGKKKGLPVVVVFLLIVNIHQILSGYKYIFKICHNLVLKAVYHLK